MTVHVQPAEFAGRASPWCPDADTHENVIARRNVLTGLWAGRLLGLSGPAAMAYAADVHQADHAIAGDADVVGKVADDLRAKGLAIPESVVRQKMCQLHREALTQLGATD